MTGFFKDLFSGNIPAAWADVTSAFTKLPAPFQAFIVKVENDAEGLLMSLAQTAYADVVTGGLTTASFVAAGKDVVAKAAAQGTTILMSDAMAAINIVASSAGVAQAPAAAPVVEPAAQV